MRTGDDADAEAWVLTTEPGQALMATVASVAVPGPADLTRWRKSVSADRVAAAVRLVTGQRRGAGKFTRAARMWFEATGLEQSTAEPVARRKALRFAGRVDTIVDFCSGIGGDTIALASVGRVLSVDADHGMARRARWNATVYDVADRVLAVQARAESFSIPKGAWVHIDPDRRARGSRKLDVGDYEPGPDFLQALARNSPGGAIKLGPASDFASHFVGDAFEIELVSLAGECKEATVWFGEPVTCRRRATRLPEGVTWGDDQGGVNATVPVGPILGWVFDPDPSLLRSGLIDGFAASHDLSRFAAGIDYLTGPVRVNSPFLTSFEVVAVLPLDLKILRREVAARGIGTLEIKTRGVDLKPEVVRARLKPRGGEPAVLLLAGGNGPARAVLARRKPP